MALSTDLQIHAQYGPAAAVAGGTSASSGNSFSQVLSAACQAIGGTDYDSFFQSASDVFQVPVNLLKAVAKAESSFNANAVSRCGAQGLMQLMPATARSLGVTDSFDPAQNIMGGAKYLRQMLDSFNGNVSLALAAYNAGPNAVKKYGGVPPYQETQSYVTKVLGYAGGDVSVPAAATAPAASAASAGGAETAASSAGFLSQAELEELFFQVYHSNSIPAQESVRLLVQELLLKNIGEDEEDRISL